jgi:rod shape-determining protein MreC
MQKTASSFAKARLLLAVAFVGMAFFLFERAGSLNFAKDAAALVLTPIQYSLYRTYLGAANQLQAFAGIGGLRQKNVALEIERATLEAEVARIGALEEENQALREQLKTPLQAQKILTEASVIGLGTAGVRGSLLLDKGSREGVRVGDFVVVKNIYLGQVAEVSPRTARISLITEPATKIPAVTSSGALGLLVGQYGTEAKLTNVIQDDRLVEGDLLLSSGEADFPKGLVLGRLASVNKVSRELFQEAKIEPLLDATFLRTVFILKGN